jgi:hypothetical protein
MFNAWPEPIDGEATTGAVGVRGVVGLHKGNDLLQEIVLILLPVARLGAVPCFSSPGAAVAFPLGKTMIIGTILPSAIRLSAMIDARARERKRHPRRTQKS